jgi:hypothetical protein
MGFQVFSKIKKQESRRGYVGLWLGIKRVVGKIRVASVPQ